MDPLTEFDLHLLAEGTHYRAYEKLGAHLREQDRVAGVDFAVWAPNATHVSVVGDFNGWNAAAHPLIRRHEAGVWERFIPSVKAGELYKYRVVGPDGRAFGEKADPYGFAAEIRPEAANRRFRTSFATKGTTNTGTTAEWLLRVLTPPHDAVSRPINT